MGQEIVNVVLSGLRFGLLGICQCSRLRVRPCLYDTVLPYVKYSLTPIKNLRSVYNGRY